MSRIEFQKYYTPVVRSDGYLFLKKGPQHVTKMLASSISCETWHHRERERERAHDRLIEYGRLILSDDLSIKSIFHLHM